VAGTSPATDRPRARQRRCHAAPPTRVCRLAPRSRAPHRADLREAVIPARAVAKLNFRLVPEQNPHEIDKLFRRHITRITPGTVRSRVDTVLVARPALVNRGHPAMRAAAAAYRKGFGAAPVFLRSDGTIPIVNTLRETLGIPTVLMGFALPDDRMHAPNEKFHLPNFYNGIATSIWFLAAVGTERNLKPDLAPRRQKPAAAIA